MTGKTGKPAKEGRAAQREALEEGQARGKTKGRAGIKAGADAAAAPVRPPRLDLLSENLITVREGQDRSLKTLPEVLELLGAGRIDAFPKLQAFQQHAWHAFLVQLGIMALRRLGQTSPSQGSERWKSALLEMTAGRSEPWCLLVPDLSSPAFLQPSVAERSLDGFNDVLERPDLLDVLILSKNHDVKKGRIGKPSPDQWVFALVSLQTMQGYSGRDNYGISRMNSGDGSRPGIGLAPRLASVGLLKDGTPPLQKHAPLPASA